MKARYRIKNWAIILILGLSQSGLHLWQAMPAPVLAQEEVHLWLPIVQRQYTWDYGSISGRVTDSSIGDPTLAGLTGAEVCASLSRCTQTDADGYYTITIQPGHWTLTVTNFGYYDITKSVPVYPAENSTLNFALSPEIVSGGNVELRLVLTWSSIDSWDTCPLTRLECANDLDAHLWMESALNAHIQWPPNPELCQEFPYACLEADAIYGSGPETIAFSQVYTDTPTTYYFGVFNYNQGRPGVPPLSQTDAHLDIYNQSGLLMELEPPEGGDWNFWYAFSMAAETGVISPTNCMALFDPSALGPEDPFLPTWEATTNKVCP